jgi:hypothetical protein
LAQQKINSSRKRIVFAIPHFAEVQDFGEVERAPQGKVQPTRSGGGGMR